MKLFLNILIAVTVFFSCRREEKGKIRVLNEISNVRISNVSFGRHPISGSFRFGEVGELELVKNKKSEKKFPQTERIFFTMTSNNREVYVGTKEKFTVWENQDSWAVINDSTEVELP